MSLEKFERLSLTDQDSTEDSTEDSTKEQIHKMEEKRISDKEVEIPSENTSPFLPSCTKSYCRTNLESTIFEHTWTIEQYKRFSTIKHVIPSFPEIGQCEILMNVLRGDNSSSIKGMKLNILTNNSFHGSCTTTIMQCFGEPVLSKFISGHISNMTLLIEYLARNYRLGDTLIINCKFEIFCNLINKTMRMNLLPWSKELSSNLTYFKDSSFDKLAHKDEDSIKFIVEEQPYVVPKKSLCAINSRYFKNICLTHDEKEKDMTNELVTHNEVESFKQVLLYITTGSIEIEQRYYNTLKDILTAADKYDVPSLKLTCQHYLLHFVNISNAIDLLQFALSSNAKFLKKHSASFIKFYLKEIRHTKGFRDLSQQNLNKIMQLIEKSKLPEGRTHHSLLPFKADKEFTFANIGV